MSRFHAICGQADARNRFDGCNAEPDIRPRVFAVAAGYYNVYSFGGLAA